MTEDNPNEADQARWAEPDPVGSQAVYVPFLVSAGELRARRTKRRHKRDLTTRPEATRRLDIGLLPTLR